MWPLVDTSPSPWKLGKPLSKTMLLRSFLVHLNFQNLEGWRFHNFAEQLVPLCFFSSKSFSSVCVCVCVHAENGGGRRRRERTLRCVRACSRTELCSHKSNPTFCFHSGRCFEHTATGDQDNCWMAFKIISTLSRMAWCEHVREYAFSLELVLQLCRDSLLLNNWKNERLESLSHWGLLSVY